MIIIYMKCIDYSVFCYCLLTFYLFSLESRDQMAYNVLELLQNPTELTFFPTGCHCDVSVECVYKDMHGTNSVWFSNVQALTITAKGEVGLK